MSILRLPLAVYNDLRAHAEETYPNECCGAFLGLPTSGGWRIISHIRSANARLHSARSRFEIAPSELVRIVRGARSRDAEVAGFYHSHPDRAAHPSATDLAEAHWLGCTTVITEVANGKAAATNAFLLAGAVEEDKRFEPMPIAIEE
jgi:proteasome lid subunit RPN8/RPN11